MSDVRSWAFSTSSFSLSSSMSVLVELPAGEGEIGAIVGALIVDVGSISGVVVLSMSSMFCLVVGVSAVSCWKLKVRRGEWKDGSYEYQEKWRGRK